MGQNNCERLHGRGKNSSRFQRITQIWIHRHEEEPTRPSANSKLFILQIRKLRLGEVKLLSLRTNLIDGSYHVTLKSSPF